MQSLASSGSKLRVSWPGTRSHTELPKTLSAADLHIAQLKIHLPTDLFNTLKNEACCLTSKTFRDSKKLSIKLWTYHDTNYVGFFSSIMRLASHSGIDVKFCDFYLFSDGKWIGHHHYSGDKEIANGIWKGYRPKMDSNLDEIESLKKATKQIVDEKITMIRQALQPSHGTDRESEDEKMCVSACCQSKQSDVDMTDIESGASLLCDFKFLAKQQATKRMLYALHLPKELHEALWDIKCVDQKRYFELPDLYIKVFLCYVNKASDHRPVVILCHSIQHKASGIRNNRMEVFRTTDFVGYYRSEICNGNETIKKFGVQPDSEESPRKAESLSLLVQIDRIRGLTKMMQDLKQYKSLVC